MPYQLVVIKGRSTSQTLKVNPEGVTTVGRQDGCQIRISSSQVSRKHCELFEKKGLLLVKDLGSSNGTLVNGKKINGQQVLEPGNMLTVGAITFRIERTDVPTGTPEPGRKPSDTAVAEAIASDASGGEDDLEIEFEVEEETLHDPGLEVGATAGPADSDEEDLMDLDETSPAPVRPAAQIPSTTEPPAQEPETPPIPEEAPTPDEESVPEIGEDAVAEYLLNIDLDDDDRL